MRSITTFALGGLALISCTFAPTRTSAEDGRVDVQALIDQAIKDRGGKVTLPKNTYRLASRLSIRDASRLVLDGQGSTFVFTSDRDGGILVEGSKGVTLTNLTIDFDPLPYTQGVIQKTDAKGKYYDIEAAAGYPVDPEKFKQIPVVHVFDAKTRGWKEEATPASVEEVSSPRKGVLRCRVSEDFDFPFTNIQAGDPVALTTDWWAVGITLNRCSDTVVKGVTILTAAGAGIYETGGEGGADISYTIKRGPKPSGATADRLLATTGDGFHSWGTRRGVTIHHSHLAFCGDDGVNVHNMMMLVLGVKDSTITVDTSLVTEVEWRKGDTVTVYDAKSFNPKGSKKVAGVEKDVVTLDSAAGIAAGDWVSSPQHASAGAVVRNCTFTDLEGRAVLMSACDSLVEGNTIRRTTQGGIWAGLQVTTINTANQAGPFPKNVTIRRNVLEDVGIGRYGRMADQSAPCLGAIGVAYEVVDYAAAAGVRNSRKIVIADNTVTQSALCGLFLSNVSDVTVSGNTFTQTNSRPPLNAGGVYGLTPKSAILVRDADRVTFRDNTVSALGKHADRAVQVDPSADEKSIDVSGVTLK